MEQSPLKPSNGCAAAMIRSPKTTISLLAFALLTATSLGYAQDPITEREPHQFLRTYIELEERELDLADDGRAVVKLLDTPVKNEIAVFGIVWIDAPIDFYLERFEDIENFEKGEGVRQIKKLSEPPRPEDFHSLVVPEKDFEALPKCKVGDCDVKIGEENIERFQRDIDWNDPDAEARATNLIHEMLFTYLEAYRRGGNEELAVYRDKKRPNFIADEFRGLLANSPYLPSYFPEFHRYLLLYPAEELPHSRNFFYWTTNEFGLKPIVRLNHVTVYRPPSDPNGGAAIASKQLYCSHYFHTALELRYLARDSHRPEAEGFYFMTLNRSRSDGLTGFTGMMLGRTIRNRVKSGQQTFLEQTKQTIERAYLASRAGR